MCAINALPAEILIAIFKHVLSDYFRGPTYRIANRDNARIDVSPVLSITHVCRWWRELATGYSLFWSRIDNESADQLQTFLERSGSAPISLYLTTNTAPMESVVSESSDRLRRFDLTVMPEAVDELVTLLTHLPVPETLECFTLSYSRFFRSPSNAPSARELLFGKSILGLKALAIHGIHNWIPANSFPYLTHLYLDFGSRGAEALQLSLLVDVLRNSPNAEFIHVSSISQILAQPTLAAPPVPLPRLRFLIIAYTSMQIAFDLLLSVTLPQRSYLRLQGMWASPRLPTLPPLPVLPVVQGMTCLEVVTEGPTVRLVAEGDSSGLWMEARLNQARGDGQRLDPWLELLHDFLPHGNVTTLLLSLGDHAQLLPTLLEHSMGVHEIHIVTDIHYEKFGGRSVAHALYTCLTASPESASPMCPLLRAIFVDISVGAHPMTPQLHALDIAEMMNSRSDVGLPQPLLSIQAFAGCKWSGIGDFQYVLAQFMHIADFNVQLLPPGPFLSPFLERLCWAFDELEEYWELESLYKPRYLVK